MCSKEHMEVNNILKFDKKECYGCTACEAVCPVKAISFRSDEEGFYYPFLDKDICVECGACLRVCNIDENNLEESLNEEPRHVFAAWSKDFESVLKSTSGGTAYHLTRRFVESGGVVYGVVLTDDMIVAHVRIESVTGLDELRGSKYVQSKLDGIFSSVKEDLKCNRKVLFIGTPCQVGGLNSFIKGRTKENLYTVDLVCHGTPSIKMFHAYIVYLEKKKQAKIISFRFRGKKKSGWRAYEEVKYNSGEVSIRISGHQPYFYGFYSSFFSKMKCYDCKYSCRRRGGDVTLSDFWGSEGTDRRLARARKYGYNLLLCNNKKGQELLATIKDDMIFIESTYDVAVKGDIRFRHSDAYPQVRDVIYKELDQIGFEGILKKYLMNKRLWIKRLIPVFIKNVIREIQCKIK